MEGLLACQVVGNQMGRRSLHQFAADIQKCDHSVYSHLGVILLPVLQDDYRLCHLLYLRVVASPDVHSYQLRDPLLVPLPEDFMMSADTLSSPGATVLAALAIREPTK